MTVWRTTGCGTNFVGKIDDCCWIPGVEGSFFTVGEYWSFGDNCVALFVQIVWDVYWFCVDIGWLRRTILVGVVIVPLDIGCCCCCWINVPFGVFVCRIFCVGFPILFIVKLLLTDGVNNNVAWNEEFEV